MDPSCKTIPQQKLNNSVNNQLTFYNLQSMFRCIHSSSPHNDHVRQRQLYYPSFTGEETEAETAQSIAPSRTANKQWTQDENQGFLTSHHTAFVLWQHKRMWPPVPSTLTFPIKCAAVLTIQLYIKLHLHSRACISQPWPVIQRKRKYISPSTKTQQIKNIFRKT